MISGMFPERRIIMRKICPACHGQAPGVDVPNDCPTCKGSGVVDAPDETSTLAEKVNELLNLPVSHEPLPSRGG
jgi:DnaJ-class molecular chaperone